MLRREANAGDTRAQYGFGRAHAEAVTGDEDPAEAVHWWTISSAGGEPAAQHALGIAYAEGYGGLPRNMDRALELWRTAAAKDNAEAQNVLGVLYSEGRFVAPDPALAEQWWTKAAEQGLPIAQYNLGGWLVARAARPEDVPSGGRWLTLAAEQEMSRRNSFSATSTTTARA